MFDGFSEICVITTAASKGLAAASPAHRSTDPELLMLASLAAL